MDRLTIRNGDGSVSQPADLKWAEALEKLAAYEDTGLTPKEVEMLKCIVGQSTDMPNVGDIVYRVVTRRVDVTGYRMDWADQTVIEPAKFSLTMYDCIGKSIFRTREEAKKHLTERDYS